MMRGSNLQDNSGSKDDFMRLQVYLAKCGVASRRSAEKIIAEGRVSVNGETIVQMGAKVSLNDAVAVDGKIVKPEKNKRYVLLYKPTGYVCSMSDEQGRPTAADLLKEQFSERLYNVGRLDMFSQGLIIFTNDGDFAKKLSHPSSEIEKEYIVESSLPIPEELPVKFCHGMRVEGVFYKARSAELLNSHRMKVVLVEGKNREIRRVFDSMDVHIRKLARVRIACINANKMRAGEFRELSSKEVQSLLALCEDKNKDGEDYDSGY